MGTCIHGSTALQIELGAEIAMLKDMHFDAPYDQLVPTIIDVYRKNIDLHQRMIDICTAMIAGEKPGVDYGQMVADMAKIRAFSDSMDKTLFQAAALSTFLLVDQRSDSKDHLNHLITTRAERSELLRHLDAHFGQKLEDKNANYLVSSGALLKYFLTEKGYRCADEPWEYRCSNITRTASPSFRNVWTEDPSHSWPKLHDSVIFDVRVRSPPGRFARQPRSPSER
jgi:hypothetical protein